jgi:hypothetical protein
LWPTIVDRGYGFLDEFGMGTPRLQAGESTACCRKGDCSIQEFHSDEIDSSQSTYASFILAGDAAIRRPFKLQPAYSRG